MASEFLGGLGREFIDMIDERLGKPITQWTKGSWFLAVMVVAATGFCLSLIWEFLVVPTWSVALWINSGAALHALQATQVNAVLQTVTFFVVFFFVIVSGISLLDGAIRMALWMRGHYPGLRKPLADELANSTPLKKAALFIMLAACVIVIGTLYTVCISYWATWYSHGCLHI